MKLWSQFGAVVCGLMLGATVVPSGLAQNRSTSDRPPAGQQRPANPPARNNRPSGSYHPQNSNRAQNSSRPPNSGRAQNSARGGNANRQPGNADRGRTNQDRPGNSRNNTSNGAQNNGRDTRGNNGSANGQRNDRPSNQARQQTPAVPPPNVQERLRNLSPQEQNRLVENQRKFNQLPPQKQQEMRQAGDNWRKLTPEQQNHIKNDLMPRWQQMPAERQRAIQQRLGVLRNMPESARNRHLEDPNFTRGMSDDDKQMLRDLSHEHVGAPDRP